MSKQRASTSERRRDPRVFADLEVDCRDQDNFLFAYVSDISSTGIFIRTNTPMAAGTLLNLRMRDAEGPLELEGIVIWINPYRPGAADSLHPGMGVRFAELSEDAKERVLRLIRRFAYLPNQSEPAESP